MIESISKKIVIIGTDLNGHFDEGKREDKRVTGKYGFKQRNEEKRMIADLARRTEVGILNAYFTKKEECRATYESGGTSLQINYVLCRRKHLKRDQRYKVVMEEGAVKQHRMVLCQLKLKVKKRKRFGNHPKILW